MSRYQEFYEDEQTGLAVTKEFVVKLFNSWKPTLQQILTKKGAIDKKVAILLKTKQAQIFLQNYIKESLLSNVLKKYLETPNDEWLLTRLLNLSESSAIQTDLSEMRTPLSTVIPKKILDFLPKKMVVDLDPEGQIIDIYSRYSNKDKNLGVKIQKQKDFIKVKDKFEQLLDKGILSKDNKTKMMSLIIAVMYDTGIRPGDEESSLSYTSVETEGPETEDKKKPKPTRELVDTFGSISLEPQHFVVLNGITNLAFYGKSGVFNKAQISNSLLNRVIKEVIIRFASEGSETPLFSIDGVPYTAKQLQAFYVSLLKASGMKDVTGHSMTDLRKLKASTVLYDYLISNKKELESKLLEIENIFSKKAYKMITDIIVNHINEAVSKSELALNHTSMNMTINSYINPQVILSFLSNSGEIENSFKDLLLDGAKLIFDVKQFVINASASRFADNGGWTSVIESGERLGLPERDEFAKEQSLLKFARVTNKKVLVVDRIEGNKAVFKLGRGTFVMPLMALPKGVKEGMRIEIALGGIPSVKKLEKKFKGLSSNDIGGDFSI